MKEKILKSLKKSPKKFSDITKELNVYGFTNRRNLNNLLQELIRENKIYFRRKDETFNLKNEETIIGIFKDTKRDFGFVETNDNESVFIPGKFRLNAFSGDSVKVLLFPQKNDENTDNLSLNNNNKKRVGKIVRIIKRNANNILCWIKNEDNNQKIICEDIPDKYTFEIEKNLKIKKLDFDDVFITKFKTLFNGKITLDFKEYIGKLTDSKIDNLIISKKNEINENFSEKLIGELKSTISEVNKKSDNNRLDLTNKLIYTIDGDDSKDLDDAISIEEYENYYLIGVHIADVSYYVKKNTLVDEKAFELSTSIYMLNKVYPMLPPILSNQLCSLNPNERKKTLTCEIKLDKLTGDVKSYKIFESLIISKFRLTYSEVDDFLNEKQKLLKNNLELSNNLKLAYDASKLLRKNKLDHGMIDFQLSEIKVKLDENDFPIKIYKKTQTVAEKLIEDFMVLANELVANYFVKNNFPSMFRLHPKPSEDNKNLLKKFFQIFNLSVKIDSNEDLDSKVIAELIDKIKDNPNETMIKKLIIQSMEKAFYSGENEGHYALGLKNYLHFTSPIRRYPDLIVHRLLRKYFFNKEISKISEEGKNQLKEELNVFGKYCSSKEREAATLENKLLDVKKTRFVENRKGQKFDAKVISITSFGMFVELDILVQGLIPLDFLGVEKYLFNNEKLELINKENKDDRYFLGQKLRVIIKEIDNIRGNITCDIIK